MTAKRPERLRCAVYTRKSSEEGLEQAFNSLDAQREACEAYIKSQAGVGWQLIRTPYDDGGISGGTMDRPALKQLLADIAAQKINTVVVYKVDRLTRSLADFAKIVDVFDTHRVSFVSVTQQFNTTTSMGRLTLNMLLSFAQFEREVTGERIRDKIAASKRKGMWMGGYVPLGYEAKDRTLVINKVEAKTIRTLFKLYREHGNARTVAAIAEQQCLRTKIRIKGDGTETGGAPFSRGHIYQILANPIYAGDIRHKDNIYPGQHKAIIDTDLWDAVQRQLAANRTNRTRGTNAKEPSLLAGLLFDCEGNRFTPSHAVKSGRRYRYYVERSLITGRSNGNTRGKRIAAKEVEGVVVAALTDFLKRPDGLLSAFDTERVAPDHFEQAVANAVKMAEMLISGDSKDRREIIARLVGRVVMDDGTVSIGLLSSGLAKLAGLSSVDGSDQVCHIDVPVRLRLRGVELKLVMAGGETDHQRQPDPALIKVVARAHDWSARLLAGEVASASELARREDLTKGYVHRILPLAFLAPDIVKAIAEGTAPIELTAERLTRAKNLPIDWAAQRRFLGFPTAK